MDPENIEFIALLKSSGWSEAEAGRQLDLDRATVNRYVHGQNRPSAQVLRLFKLILANHNPDVLRFTDRSGDRAARPWDKLLDDLEWMEESDRARVMTAITHIVAAIPRRKASSTAASQEEKRDLIDAAESAVDARIRGDEKKPLAAGTKPKTISPLPGVSPRSKPQPARAKKGPRCQGRSDP